MDIKKWVAAARLHGGFTQEDLGTALGKTKSNISAWENGHHEPSFGQMGRISTITKYPMPVAGYKPKKSFSPYAVALAELVDKQPEDARQTVATIAKTAIDQHIKEARKGEKTASPSRTRPTKVHPTK